MGNLEIVMGVLEIFGWCPGDIWWSYFIYFMGVLEILCRFPEDIWCEDWRYL